MKKLFCLVALLATLLVFCTNACAADVSGLPEDISLQPQRWLDETLALNAGQNDWYAVALAHYGCDTAKYASELKRYINTARLNYADKQRCILTLAVCNAVDEQTVASTARETCGKQGVMSIIFALNLLGFTCENAQEPVQMLLSLQAHDGGWCMTGSVSDADVTAMAVQALAQYRQYDGVQTALDKAVERLADMQLPNGGYKSYGSPNAESCAQVIMALCALDIDINDSRFVKDATVTDALMSYRVDGGFCHISGSADAMATAQGMLALLALQGINPYSRAKTAAEPVFTVTASATASTAATVQPTACVSLGIGEQDTKAKSYKPVAAAVIAAVAVLLCVAVALGKGKGKYKRNNCIFIAAVAVTLVFAVLFTDIQGAEQYYTQPLEGTYGTVSMEIRCDVLLGKTGAHIPEDGIIVKRCDIGIDENATVYDALITASKKYGITTETNAEHSYVKGIGGLYEADFGALSGWVYTVNGQRPAQGCNSCVLQPGDIVIWYYTLELGNDIN